MSREMKPRLFHLSRSLICQLLTSSHHSLQEEDMKKMHFGWIAPVIGVAKTNYIPVVMLQEAEVLPVVAKHFDSLWVADHLFATAPKPHLADKGNGNRSQ